VLEDLALVDLLFDGAAGDQPVDGDPAALADSPGAFSGLFCSNDFF
jgi:hypothetical protein